jgi:methylenetetrahydrofolate reductase (NADPH)
MRPNVGICASITINTMDTVPHVVVWWFYQRGNRIFISRLSLFRINNVMALRGDAMKDEQSLSQNGWKQPCYRFGPTDKIICLHEVVQ